MLLLTLPVQFYSGLGFYNGAYHAIKSMSGNMDLLISMGTLTAFVYSSIVVMSGGTINGGSVFFDASAFIITLILTGNYLENMTKSRANRAAGKLQDLIPGTSHLVDTEGNVNDVKTDTLRVGDVILIRPGEAIPADGSILDGKSEIDESMLTGEQAPVLRMTGNMVTSGTLNLNGLLKVKITRIGKDSTVSQIYELIQGANGNCFTTGTDTYQTLVSHGYITGMVLQGISHSGDSCQESCSSPVSKVLPVHPCCMQRCPHLRSFLQIKYSWQFPVLILCSG